MKRLLALICIICLMGSLTLPGLAVGSDPDFAVLAQRGDAPTQTTVEILTPPKFYAQSIDMFFHGKYTTFTSITDGKVGVVDCYGNVYRVTSQPGSFYNLINGRIYAYFEDKGLVYYDFNGNALFEGKYALYPASENFNSRDQVTGLGFYAYGNIVLRQTGESLGKFYMDRSCQMMYAEALGKIYDGKVAVMEKGKWGIRRLFGEILIPCEYDFIQFIGKDTFIAKKGNKAWVQDLSGTVLLSDAYEDIAYWEFGFTPSLAKALAVKQGGKWGMIDLTGKVLCPFVYDEVGRWLSETTQHYVFQKDGSSHVIRWDAGTDLTAPGLFSQDWEAREMAWGVYTLTDPETKATHLVDGTGELLFDKPFSFAEQHGSFIQLTDYANGKSYVLDLDAHLLLDLPTIHLSFTEHSVIAEYADRLDFYDLQGKLIKSWSGVKLAAAIGSTNQAVAVSDGAYIALADDFGEPITDFIYLQATSASRGRLMNLQDNDGWHLFGADGKPVIDQALDNPVEFGNSNPYYEEPIHYAYYMVGGRYGFLRLVGPDTPVFLDVGESSWYAPGVRFCFNTGLMKGVGAGNFDPNANMTRAMLVQVLYNISGEKCEAHGFADVKPGAWYYDAVNWAAKNGVVNGTSKTTFSPDDPVTREQMVTILYRYARQFGAKGGNESTLERFVDLSRLSDWAREPMAWAVENGIITGKEHNTLDPKGSATRAEIATVLMRFVKRIAEN